jgi:hypothetical protein
MTPTHGRSPRGARLVDRVPHGRWRTLTFLAALRCDRLTAPCVFDGPINGSSFQAYVAQFLVPTLKPGDIVVLDNLGSHKCQAVRRTIRAAGAKLFFFSSHCPDPNPIEQVIGPRPQPWGAARPISPVSTRPMSKVTLELCRCSVEVLVRYNSSRKKLSEPLGDLFRLQSCFRHGEQRPSRQLL